MRECGAVVTRDRLPRAVAEPWAMTRLLQNLVGNAIKFRGASPPRVHVSSSREGGGRQSGTGVGLAICKKIVEYHGGRLWLESDPGQGSTFFFSLPG